MTHAAELHGAVTVLVVEDEALISEMVVDVLNEHGLKVHVAFNADDALRLLTSDLPIDVLFTDINIGDGMDGTMLAARARELRPNLPVVFASGRVSQLDHLSRIPGATCLPKPYNPAQVWLAVEGLFATRH